ncbi:MAG TPA: MFS transporter [Caldimonas sp.]|jgi:MFS family permease|nr:MFS transporter [Caldimonas sp.]HEX2542035.1 MFS transporter [Caldimonas sp.]
MPLGPVPAVSGAELEAGERALVLDAAWASLTGALSSGVVLAAFAIALGAGPMVIGLLAAIPLLAQVAQLPAILLIERYRERKRIGVIAITASRFVILAMAALPFLTDRQATLSLLVLAQAIISILVSAGSCSVNSWLHQLIPHARLGPFFSRRLLWGTLLGGAGSLAAGAFIDSRADGERLQAFAVAFGAAALAGFASSYYLARAPEPRMLPGEPAPSLLATLRRPLQQPNFRRLLVFLASWSVASNIAAPFITVYLMRQLGYGLGIVTALGVASQLASAFALYVWGRVSSDISNKGVLAVALPTYFLCTAALMLGDRPAQPQLALAILVVLHVALGAANGGIGLAVGNLGLKLAPEREGTSYLAVIGIVSALAGGLAPLVGGSLAEWAQDRELAFLVRWTSPTRTREVNVLGFQHWEFLFLLSAALGLYVLHALSRIQEEGQNDERLVIQHFAVEAARTVTNLSSVAGALGGLFPFRQLSRFGRMARGRRARGPEALEGARE